jgi:hypothetical protein
MTTRQMRTRGAKGKAEAAMRQALSGDGPDAGITERGKAVVVWGLPPLSRVDVIRRNFEQLHGVDLEGCSITLIAPR